MKKLSVLLSVIIAMFFYLNLNAQIIEKEYPELKQVMPYGPDRICKTNDNGFAFTGFSSNKNVYMVKLNSEYEIEWHKQVFAKSGQTNVEKITQDDSGYFYIGGSCYSDDNNDDICYLVKLDKEKKQKKEKIWKPKNSKYSFLTNFVLKENGLMVLSSVGFENINDSVFNYITFLNKKLEIVIEKQIAKILCGTMCIQGIYLDENGFLLVGLGNGLRFMKIENDSIVWKKKIDSGENPKLYRFIPYNCESVSDGYIIIGITENYKPGLVKIDKKGNLIWVKEFEVRPSSEYSMGMNCWESKHNNGYIIVCNDDNKLISAKTLVIKVDYEGEIIWRQESLGSTNEAVYLENGNIVCIGRNQQSITCLDVFYDDVVKIDSELIINPKSILLFQNYPNPFNSATTISYDLPNSSFVTISIYDINGKFVEKLVNENKEAGSYSVKWNASQFSSGIYLYKIQANEFTDVNKCILLK